MKEEWLNDMIHAALEDSGEREPDFAAVTAASENRGGKVLPFRRPAARWLIPAAAAVLAASVATPLGIVAGHRSEERRINREIQEMFVDGLIGESLFDEGLADNSRWFSDIEVSEDFFES